MSAQLSINKEDLKKHSYLAEPLKSFCYPITELDDIIIYRPLPGKLMPFINFLTQLEIDYKIEFQTHEFK